MTNIANEKFQNEAAYKRSENSTTKELVDYLRIKLDAQINEAADLKRQIALLDSKLADNYFSQQLTGAAIKNAESYLSGNPLKPRTGSTDDRTIAEAAQGAVKDALTDDESKEEEPTETA